jgi:hypothetical protein
MLVGREETLVNRRRMLLLPFALFLIIGSEVQTRTYVARAASDGATVAPATVYFLNTTGHRVRNARAKSTIKFVLRFTSPRSFPSGYTDLRFIVYVHGKAQRTVIYGAPKFVKPGATLIVALPVPVSPAWRGTVRVVGTVALLAKPAGLPLHRAGRGSANLTVTR